MNRTRVVVVDDQELVRAGFVALITATEDLQVVGQAGHGAEGVRLIRKLRPDVALMDIRMPVLNGIDAIRQIRADPTCAATRVVVLTTFGLDDYVFGALRSGANGYLLKDTPPEELLRCIRAVADGGSLLSPSVTQQLLDEFARLPVTRSRQPPELTGRESDVLELVCQGLSNGQIAGRLFIGAATVKTYVSRLLVKFAVETRVGLVIAAYECGLLPAHGG